MKNNRRALVSIVWILLGIGLIVAGFVTEIDEFWSGLGAGFVSVGVLQLLRWGKYASNEEYREKMDVEAKDERNRYLAAKAWGWAGYLFVIIGAVACIALRIAGQELLSLAASGAVCLIITLYWISYFILRRKY
ncbi:MAG: hypothetical protein E7439_07320 [Ruminococcaceae bacterium]|nr:hypothetical protein [Oscillospiraceae bacterium]